MYAIFIDQDYLSLRVMNEGRDAYSLKTALVHINQRAGVATNP
jgi:hypothetical protein